MKLGICYNTEVKKVKNMTGWLNSDISHKLVALLVASVFVVVTFACFTMATNHGHSHDFGVACETVMSLADNVLIQTGLVLLLVFVAASLCFQRFNAFSLQDTLYRLYVFHRF